MRDSVLERYALAYIKENGSDNDVQRFLQSQHIRNATSWYDKDFKNLSYGLADKERHRNRRLYNAPICLDHFFQSDPIFKMNMLINTSTHI